MPRSPGSPRPRGATLALAVLLFGAAAARAGGPASETVAGADALGAGTLDGLALRGDGVLVPGPVFEDLDLEADTAWCAVRSGDSLWVGLGSPAGLVRVHADGHERVAFEDALMVTACAPLPEGSVAAAVFPGGRLVKVTRTGEVTPLARLAADHVWAIDSAPNGVLTVATGLPAALWRVDPFGAVEKITDVDDEHARCLARAGEDGPLWIGTAPKGHVLAWQGGRLSVVRDLEAQEVVGILPLPRGDDGRRGLLVAANADQAGGNAQLLATLLRSLAEPQATKPGQPAAARPALQDGTILHLESGGAIDTLWQAEKTAVLSLAPAPHGAFAGTYPSARVLEVAPGRASVTTADLPEAEASVLVSDGTRLLGVVTSNPAVLHSRKDDVHEGTWISAPLDAGAVALWGRVETWGRGVRGLDARAGETSEPDDTWSPWAALAGQGDGAGALDARARFVQLRVTLGGEGAELRGVELVRLVPNRAPVLSALEAKKAGAAGEAEAPPTAEPRREITWKAEDPDGDRLRTTVRARRDGRAPWQVLVDAEVLAKPAHTWDTTGLPDGRYEIEVEASDAPDNAAGRARVVRERLQGVRVDNTPPVADVKAERKGSTLRIHGEAEDPRGGRIHTVRVALDGGPWRVLDAADGLFDSAREAFVLETRVRGRVEVVVQVVDADGNLVAIAPEVR